MRPADGRISMPEEAGAASALLQPPPQPPPLLNYTGPMQQPGAFLLQQFLRQASGAQRGRSSEEVIGSSSNETNTTVIDMKKEDSSLASSSASFPDSTRSVRKCDLKEARAREGEKLLTAKCVLRSHFDAVRDLHFCTNFLATVSEDCLLKLWSVRALLEGGGEEDHVEPVLNFRGHTGPLFAVAGSSNASGRSLLYSAGSESIIRIWAVPSEGE